MVVLKMVSRLMATAEKPVTDVPFRNFFHVLANVVRKRAWITNGIATPDGINY